MRPRSPHSARARPLPFVWRAFAAAAATACCWCTTSRAELSRTAWAPTRTPCGSSTPTSTDSSARA
eukprot:6360250-Prymnesium_polylepis.2